MFQPLHFDVYDLCRNKVYYYYYYYFQVWTEGNELEPDSKQKTKVFNTHMSTHLEATRQR